MLIGFKLQNFRSFSGEQTFTFLSSCDHAHEATHVMATGMRAVPRISKAAIAFGPNSSGKTNLLIAFATCRDLMLHSTTHAEAQFRERYTPFRFGPTASRPTEFEIDVMLDKVRYRYAFSYDAQRIRSERLLVYRTGKSQRWFDRRFDPATQTDEWAPFSPSFNGPRENWRRSTGPQALFFSTAARRGSHQLAPLMHWVDQCLEILFAGDIANVNRLAGRIRDVRFKGRVLDMLRAADIQVTDIRAADESGLARGAIEFLYARPGWSPVWLDSVFEAAGTHRLMGLLVPLLDAVEHGKLLLIDEFDTSLHPLVARFLVRRITDPALSANGAQLLLTSHNTTLMDLDFLRRDEIWLVQLNEARSSTLAPLQRSSPRKHELIAKNYLKGRYGAIPALGVDGPLGVDVPLHRSPVRLKRPAGANGRRYRLSTSDLQ